MVFLRGYIAYSTRCQRALLYKKKIQKNWCRDSLPSIRNALNEIDKYFNVPMNNEVNAILSSIEALFVISQELMLCINNEQLAQRRFDQEQKKTTRLKT